MPYLLRLTLLCALLLALTPAARAADDKPLTLGFMPYLNAKELLAKYAPLADYLGKAIGRPVQVVVAKDYAEHIRNTGEDKLDISFLGGSPYVVIGDQYGRKPLLARYEFNRQPTFRAVIFTAKNSAIHKLSEMRGRAMAFGSAKSTLSTQVPLYMLMQAGVGLKDLGSYEHLRNHENVILGVELGDFDAGAVAEEVYREHGANRDVRILAESQSLSTHVFVTRANMPASLRERIAKALLNASTTPVGQEALRAIGGTLTGFAPVADSDYDLHRTILSDVLPALRAAQQ
ncbi:phosphate/phosphite/phosphonate ABC transporter substrate-binding protein [Magnetofaba australis]|nr:phosphate/phosphite/phosphonate ABC transporter substrate-binding protein [Magnetofaba australis]